jgi:CDP-diacylglycerol--serine O-phosphatidyltransferase
MFAVALYAGLTMVTNVPFYSFKDIQMKKSVPFAVIVLIALGIAVINIHPPVVLFAIFVHLRPVGLCALRLAQGQGHPTSVISTSTDEPDERGLHR